MSDCYFVARGPFGGRANQEGDRLLLRVMNEPCDGNGFGVRMTATSTVAGPFADQNLASRILSSMLAACPEMRTDQAHPALREEPTAEEIDEIRVGLGFDPLDAKPVEIIPTPRQDEQMKIIDRMIEETEGNRLAWEKTSVGFIGWRATAPSVRIDFRNDGSGKCLQVDTGCRPRSGYSIDSYYYHEESIGFPPTAENGTVLIETNGGKVYHSVTKGHPYHSKLVRLEEAIGEYLVREKEYREQRRSEQEEAKKRESEKQMLIAVGMRDPDPDPDTARVGEGFQRRCPDCDTEVGYTHFPKCDVEHCTECGGQRSQCECEEHDPLKAVWLGYSPGVDAYRQLGWYARMTPGRGWQVCGPDDEGATENLTRWTVFVMQKNARKNVPQGY